ncbi:MAG: hypothetical protein HY22_00185 [[Candidatus Thermochlorobacteriaceae] bacterium GBChlB]|nr:MAG: hypothetical protein HY22_00185 [[Candidatus Thermochlorobacteriaceae] bacterium GBChlB]
MKKIVVCVIGLALASSVQAQSPQALFEKGEAHLENGEYPAAMLAFTKVLQQDSLKFWRAYLKRGYARQLFQDTSGALNDYSAAIRIKPDSVDGYFYRALLRRSLREYARAGADLSAAIFINPKNPVFYYYRGLCNAALKELDEAVLDFNNALKLDATFADALSYRAACYAELQRDTLALTDYTAAIALRPSAQDYFQRGKLRRKLRKSLEALIDFDNAVKLDPKFAEAYFARGMAKMENGMRSQAFGDFVQARALGYEPAEKLLSQYNKAEEVRGDDSLRIYGTKEIVVEADSPEFEKVMRETKIISARGISVAEFASSNLNVGFGPVVAPNASVVMTNYDCNMNLLQMRRASQVPIQCIAQLLRDEAARTNDQTIKDAAYQLTNIVREIDIWSSQDAFRVRDLLLNARQILKNLNAYLAQKTREKQNE